LRPSAPVQGPFRCHIGFGSAGGSRWTCRTLSPKVTVFAASPWFPTGDNRSFLLQIQFFGHTGGVNWPSGCGFIHAGRCMIGDYSELTFRSSAHAIMRAKAAPISARSSRTSPGTRLVVARNLTFEDRRHARTWRIDFWPCDIKNRLQHIAAVEEEFALFFCSHTI